MSLLKLKSKKEPIYTSKSIVNYDQDLKEAKISFAKNEGDLVVTENKSMMHYLLDIQQLQTYQAIVY